MRHSRFSLWIRPGLVMVILLLAGLACSLSTGDDEKTDSDSVPTLAASITPPGTRTPIPSFTPFRTSTPTQGFAAQPTPTRLAFFPTWTPFQYQTTPYYYYATAYPYDVRISYPVDGSQVAGYLTIVGSASHPRFLQYALEWGPHPNPSNLWYPLSGPQRRTVINGGLAAWDTRTVNDGTYQLRLHVWLTDGTETYALVTAIRVSNTQATAVPTQTPTPRPNQAPRLDPIPGQVLDAGQSSVLTVVVSDPDGDPISLFVSSSNPAIVGVQATAANQITISGVTAGTATVTVTANDNRGGLVSTAFLVTVRGQNRAPTISPLVSQTIDVGQTRNLAIAASDPDGDSLTVTAISNAPAVLTATAVNATTVQITGVTAGTAYVTVTASDGKGGVVNTAFQVTVGRVNRAPTIDQIPTTQNLTVGSTVNVTYVATDPDGDRITATANSDTPGVVTAEITSTGIIRLSAISAGYATVTLAVRDDLATTIGTFAVAVTTGNRPPTLAGIPPQTMSVGETRDVSYIALDPDGDALTPNANSDNASVVMASVTAPGTIRLLAQGAGTATVTLTVSDGRNPAVSTSFTVSVAALNIAPSIETIPMQILADGETRNVAYTAVDPDGDSLTATASSDNTSVVTASVPSAGTIRLEAISAGTATVTLTVQDGKNPAVTMPFTVEVVSNAPPSVDPIAAQSLMVTESLDVPYNATDPEGDTLTVTVTSDNTGVVTASISTPGTVRLAAVSAGTATITLSVDDGRNPAVTTTFAVTVQDVNDPPTVNPIDAQELATGEVRDVFYGASDADGDPLTATAASDNDSVVQAAVNVAGVITLTASNEGAATVTLTVSDGKNSPVTTTFAVTVKQANVPPTIDPIGPQSLTAGESLDVPYTASDGNGDSLTVTASSDNPGVVTAGVSAPGVIQLSGVAAGTATVTVSVNDGVNTPVTTTFGVSVAPANVPPVIDPIGPQNLTVGDSLDVAYAARDDNGDPLTVTASSDNPGVVTAGVSAPGVIQLSGVAAGTATVTVSVNDGVNPPVTTTFSVNVAMANVPPVIDPIGPQTLVAGGVLDVAYAARDDNGDLLTVTATSDNPGVVTAVVSAPGMINLSALSAGSATVTVSVNDGVNPAVTTTFSVNVAAPNVPPVIDPIGPQSMTAGQSLDVAYAARDDNGDPLTVTATSDNPGVVNAFVSAPGVINLSAVAGGTATVTVSVSDGINPPITTTFTVNVAAPNVPPVIDPIGPQSMTAGQSLDVAYAARDDNGDPLTVTATSDNPGVVNAFVSAPGVINLSAVAGGTATVTVSVSDGINPQVTTAFLVTVQGVNNPPSIQPNPIPNQSVNAGEQVTVAIVVSDPDGDLVVVTALSQNQGIAEAQAVGGDSIVITGVAPGDTWVDVTLDDANGGVLTTSFNVIVAQAQPTFNLMDYPVVPAISGQMAQSLQQVYWSGMTNFGNQAGAFAKVGDDAMDSDNFMKPFAVPGSYNLDSFGGLQALIDVYAATSVRASIDPTINSFNVDSVAAEEGYGIENLSGPTPAGPPCDVLGGTPLSCEYQATRPSIALISFSAPNVTYMNPDQFRSELQVLVLDSLSTYGVIPVLATIPAGNGYTTEQLAPYNQAIVEVASQSGTGGIPLWNLWRAMQERGISDPNSVAPQGPADFSALNYGYNIRNLTALQTLEAVRQAAGMQ